MMKSPEMIVMQLAETPEPLGRTGCILCDGVGGHMDECPWKAAVAWVSRVEGTVSERHLT